MGIVTISSKTPPPRAGNGFFLPEGSDIPVMKGRKELKLKKEIAKLDEALRNLAETPCGFWACEGPNRPRDMCTCKKCYAMRAVASVRATLARALERKEKKDGM